MVVVDAAILTLAGRYELTVSVILFEVAGEGATQVALEVITTVTASLLDKVVVVKVVSAGEVEVSTGEEEEVLVVVVSL